MINQLLIVNAFLWPETALTHTEQDVISSAYLLMFSLVVSPALRLWGHSSGQRWPFRPLESRTKNEPASPKVGKYLHFRLELLNRCFCPIAWPWKSGSQLQKLCDHKWYRVFSEETTNLKWNVATLIITWMMMACCEHTLNCYSWFPEHIRVFQQLRLISVDSDDLATSVQNSAIAQPEVTHRACKHMLTFH